MKQIDHEIIYKKLDQLTPYSNNARCHSPEQIDKLVRSMRSFGFTNPILIDPQGEIIAGHGRFEAAAALKLPTVPCIVLSHLSDAEKRAYVIADNKIALDASWDMELLADEMIALEDDGIDITVCGFDDDELDDLIPSGNEEQKTSQGSEQVETSNHYCKTCGQKIKGG